MKLATMTMVAAETLLRRERRLPQPGELIGSVGAEVTPVQVVGRSQVPGGYVVVAASELLQVPAAEVENYLVVQVGDVVEAGEVLLRRRLPPRKVVAPVAGQLHLVRDGRLLLQRPFVWHELRALLRGRIVSQIPQRGVVIETMGALVEGRWATAREGFGRLRLLAERAGSVLQPDMLGSELAQHVVVAGVVRETAVLERAAALQVAGLVVGSLDVGLIPAAQAAPFPIIMTEGFGQMAMSEPVFNLLQRLPNREATLFGAASEEGDRRPELIVTAVDTNLSVRELGYVSLAVGQRVRLLRAPYAQQIGRVVKLFEQAQALDTGIYAPGVAVRLVDGQVVFVPDANLDVIQESD